MREKYIQACVEILHNEVYSKKGFSGFAIKSAYRSLCALKPNAPHKVINHLFDDFWSEYQKKGSDPQVLGKAWLDITDKKAAPYEKTALFGVYQMLRPSALTHVEAAIPKLTQLFDQLGTEGTSTKFK